MADHVKPEDPVFDNEYDALRFLCLRVVRGIEISGETSIPGDRLMAIRTENGWSVQVVPRGEREECPYCGRII